MKAGRELDALIAEKVMGWTRWIGCRGQVFFMPLGSMQSEYIQHQIAEGALKPFAGAGDERNAPAYSTDIAHAWLVVDALMKFGCQPYFELRTCGDYWTAKVSRQDYDSDTADGDTAPHAIGNLALAAVGHKVSNTAPATGDASTTEEEK